MIKDVIVLDGCAQPALRRTLRDGEIQRPTPSPSPSSSTRRPPPLAIPPPAPPVRRLLGDDPEGLLYIGMTAAAIQRFGGPRAAIDAAYNFTGASGHTYTNRISHPVGEKISVRFVSASAKERLHIEIEGYQYAEHIPNDYVVREHEADLIRAYTEDYGEPPPLNDAR